MSSIFTKIIDGEIPGRFVWKDEKCVAFMDIQPASHGHLLVVPREEIDRWPELPAELAAHLFAVAHKISGALDRAFDKDRVALMIAGFDVPHAHIHVFPTNTMADYDFSKVIKADETDPALMDEAAEKLRAIMDTNEAGYAY